MVNPTWEERDLPVLRAALSIIEESDHGQARIEEIQRQTGFDEKTVQRSLQALVDGVFFTSVIETDWGIHGVGRPTAPARQAVGLWPTPEGLADRLVQAMSAAADREPDEEKRGWLRRTADWLGTAGRDVAVDVTAAVINRQISGAA
ncbi:hypothetical protein [Micromonospora chersina]|uniref:hypothetical protein n=1 Tax=Micromonospora chersina TaxID=47854 RepID=UPI00367D5949